jgi:hypothetical protein
MKFIHVENMVVLLIFCSRGLNWRGFGVFVKMFPPPGVQMVQI